MTLDQALASPQLLALAGAMVGGMRAGILSLKTHGKWRALSDGLIGLVFAVSMADWLTPPAYPRLAALIGLLAGTTGARALDAASELMPEFLRELALGWARRLTGESGERSFRRASGWGDVESPRRKHQSDNPDDWEP